MYDYIIIIIINFFSQVAVDERLVMLTKKLSLFAAGGTPEVWLTAFQLLAKVARVDHMTDKNILIHAGASGVVSEKLKVRDDVNFFFKKKGNRSDSIGKKVFQSTKCYNYYKQ